MSVIGEIIVKIGADSSKFNQEMGKTAKSMEATANKLKSIGRGLTLGVTLPIVAIGTASLKMAMDAEESENLFEVSMGSMAGAARRWSEDISKSLGLNDYSVRKNIATFNVMLTSMGLTENKAFDMSKALTQLAYDMSSFYNIKTEEAFQKLQAGISGETEPLKRLGIVVNETTVKTYALTHGILKQGQEMTEKQKIMARYGVIMEATKKAQGDMGRTLDSTSNQVRITKEQLSKLAIEIGKNLTPIAHSFLKIIQPILETLAKMNPTTLRFIMILAMMVAAIGPLITLIANVIKGVGMFTSIMDKFNISGLKTTLIILGVVAALVALAAIIAVLSGKTGEVERTFGAIQKGVQTVPGQYGNQYGGQGYQYNNNLPRYASGTNYVPRTMTAIIHEGEAIIPASQNPFNSNTEGSFGEENNFYGDVIIPAKDIKEMQDITDFFRRYKQVANQGV